MFRIVKDSNKKSVWDTFYLDTFKNKSVALTCDLVQEILQKNLWSTNIDKLELLSDVIHYIFINMGGTKDTPIREVLAFSYIATGTPNFRVDSIMLELLDACYCYTTLTYISENELTAPSKYITLMRDKLSNDDILSMVLSNFHMDAIIVEDESEETFDIWFKDVRDKIEVYITGVNATKNAFDI